MKVVTLGQGHFSGAELEGFPMPPAWRKATRNMVMATSSIERALAQAPGFIDRAADDTGLILGSNSGELETSSEFLLTLSRTKVARPVLFQNSLHNATTGFASIHFKLTGPTFSISSGQQMPFEALHMALTLMNEGVCRACLVTLVEGHKMLSDLIEEKAVEGAATLLLSTEELAAELGFAGRPEFVMEEWASPIPNDPRVAPLTSVEGISFFRRMVGNP